MEIDLWPIVGRSQLVQAFKPGESGSREAPFRTLRTHGWATAGVSVVTRQAQRASGRLSIFSVLNVDAARSARQGDPALAAALAKAAAGIEASSAFVQLGELLTGKAASDVSCVVEGGQRESWWSELDGFLRHLARQTKAARARRPLKAARREMVAGKISETGAEFLVLTAAGGRRTAVPRWLAHAAHRENVGDCLALVTDRLDERRAVINAVPGIDLNMKVPDAAFTPFGRAAPVHRLTRADARQLSRPRAPLKILVPVTFES